MVAAMHHPAFLKPALRRSNLVMWVRALVDRIHFEKTAPLPCLIYGAAKSIG